jgi:colicin import membrane protein
MPPARGRWKLPAVLAISGAALLTALLITVVLVVGKVPDGEKKGTLLAQAKSRPPEVSPPTSQEVAPPKVGENLPKETAEDAPPPPKKDLPEPKESAPPPARDEAAERVERAADRAREQEQFLARAGELVKEAEDAAVKQLKPAVDLAEWALQTAEALATDLAESSLQAADAVEKIRADALARAQAEAAAKARAETLAKKAEEEAGRQLKLAKELAKLALQAQGGGQPAQAAKYRKSSRETLEEIVKKYPKTRVAEEASELLGP